MLRFVILAAICLLAPTPILAQDAPPSAHARPQARQLPFQGQEARINQVTIAHLQRCWRSTADLGPHISVTLAFTLNEDGSLAGQPRVLHPRGWLTRDQLEGVRRAIEAVRRCDPLPLADDAELAGRYDLWREYQVTFATSTRS
jgi:hypothetical protein